MLLENLTGTTSIAVDSTLPDVDPSSLVVDPPIRAVDTTPSVVDLSPPVIVPTSSVPTQAVLYSMDNSTLDSTSQPSTHATNASDNICLKSVPSAPRKGRCHHCSRHKDKKVRTVCKLCHNHVCNLHSTNFTLYFSCEGRVSFS